MEFPVSKTKPTIPGHDDKYKTGILGRRWAVDVYFWGIMLGFQCLWGSKWIFAGSYYSIGFTKHWGWGRPETLKYDGYHECFSLGFLHICWCK